VGYYDGGKSMKVGRWDVVGCCGGCDIVMVGKSVKVERWKGGMWWDVAMGGIL
jgi:hypothetical protein